MIEKDLIAVSSSVVDEEFSDIYVLIWVFSTLILSGFFSVLRWLNTPMPTRTWGQALLAYANGVALSLLAALYLGDKVLSHEMSILHFTFIVMSVSLGGAHVFGYIAKLVTKNLFKQVDKLP